MQYAWVAVVSWQKALGLIGLTSVRNKKCDLIIFNVGLAAKADALLCAPRNLFRAFPSETVLQFE